MTAFDDDFAAADAQFAEAFGGDVTFVRGGSEITVTATAALQDYEATDTRGAVETVRSRDYVIEAADLAIAGSPIEPRSGDRIKETIAGTVEVFQAMPLGNRPVAEHTDASHTAWLIHTKHIGSE